MPGYEVSKYAVDLDSYAQEVATETQIARGYARDVNQKMRAKMKTACDKDNTIICFIITLDPQLKEQPKRDERQTKNYDGKKSVQKLKNSPEWEMGHLIPAFYDERR